MVYKQIKKCPCPDLSRDCKLCFLIKIEGKHIEGSHERCTRQHGHAWCEHV